MQDAEPVFFSASLTAVSRSGEAFGDVVRA